jgi:hypothetical protein
LAKSSASGGGLTAPTSKNFSRSLDRLVLVTLGDESQRVGANPEIHVHRDEDRRSIRRAIANLDRALQDRVIPRSWIQRNLELGPAIRHEHPQRAAVPDLHAARQRSVFVALGVEYTRNRARVAAAFVRIALELIDLLDHVDRQDQIVVLELEDRVRIVE